MKTKEEWSHSTEFKSFPDLIDAVQKDAQLPEPQSNDSTRWKFQQFFSPNRAVHIDNLEKEVSRLLAKVERYQSVLERLQC